MKFLVMATMKESLVTLPPPPIASDKALIALDKALSADVLLTISADKALLTTDAALEAALSIDKTSDTI